MDLSDYKKLTVSRGLTYNYYYSKAEEGKPYLTFFHGFPSSSWDWKNQVVYFKAKGFGLVVPDLLGYGDTDKPVDAKKYVPSGMARDVIDILDAEGIEKAVAIGHDWGSRVVSRLANDKPERFSGFAFITVGYIPPRPDSDPVKTVDNLQALVGREVIGYWTFFFEEDAPQTIENHFDSFFSLFFPHDPMLWKDHICVRGATKAWLEADRQAPLPSYLTPEDKEHYRKVLISGGLSGPLQWYYVMSTGALAEDDKLVPPERIPIHKPVYFGACTKDQVCLSTVHGAPFKFFAKGPFTLEEFDTDHWPILSHPDEVNSSLHKWIDTL